MKLKFIGLCALAALSLTAGAAQATITTVTVTGTILQDDTTGLFNHAVAGSRFTFVETADDTIPNTFQQVGPVSSNLAGGSASGVYVTPETSVFTLNGISYVNAGNYQSDLYTFANGSAGQLYFYTQDQKPIAGGSSYVIAEFNLVATADIFVGAANWHDTFSTDLAPGNASIADISYMSDNHGFQRLQLDLAPDHVCLTSTGSCGAPGGGGVGGVPEPTAWALMLVGFGGIGGVLRQRRRVALAA